jgi:hypothetical protein
MRLAGYARREESIDKSIVEDEAAHIAWLEERLARLNGAVHASLEKDVKAELGPVYIEKEKNSG